MSLLRKIYWDLSQRYYNLQKTARELKSLSIEITGLCNLHCKHCYMNSNNNLAKDLTIDEWKTFFSQIKKDFGKKISLRITGGEPLSRPDFFEILNYLKSLGFNVSLATNGTLLNETNINKLKKNISALSISLDGLKSNHNYLRQADVFDKTIENVKLCKKIGIKYLAIKTSVYKKNISELDQLFELIKTLEVDEWHLFPMEPTGRGKINKQEILSKAEYNSLCDFIDKIKSDKKNKLTIRFGEEGNNFMYKKTCEACQYKLCTAGISSCSILYNGDIVSCIQQDRNNLNIQGNIKKDNFKQIWDTKFLPNRNKDYKSCNNHHF